MTRNWDNQNQNPDPSIIHSIFRCYVGLFFSKSFFRDVQNLKGKSEYRTRRDKSQKTKSGELE